MKLNNDTMYLYASPGFVNSHIPFIPHLLFFFYHRGQPLQAVDQSPVVVGFWLDLAMQASVGDRRAGGEEKGSVFPSLSALHNLYVSIFRVVPPSKK